MSIQSNKCLTLVLATGNQHKLLEMRELLKSTPIRLLGATEIGGLPSVEETGSTFSENAVKKAVETAEVVDFPVLADDSGFAVVALDGAPGVRSARYAGPAASDQENLEKVLREMSLHQDRRCSFVCVLAVADQGGLIGKVEGRVNGLMTGAPRGRNGFGYDPVFLPQGYQQTFAELPAGQKNRISHRAQAVRRLIASDWFRLFLQVG